MNRDFALVTAAATGISFLAVSISTFIACKGECDRACEVAHLLGRVSQA